MAKNTGARGLRALIENILTDAMFEVLIYLSLFFKNCRQSMWFYINMHNAYVCARFRILRQEVTALTP
jgi:hypothetical protein